MSISTLNFSIPLFLSPHILSPERRFLPSLKVRMGPFVLPVKKIESVNDCVEDGWLGTKVISKFGERHFFINVG